MVQFTKHIPINITGGSFADRSRPLSSQETKNFYPQVVEQGKDQFVLRSFYGLKNLGSATAGKDRGMFKMNGVAYRVVGGTLYSFDSSGTHTSIGAIAGSSRCVFATDGSNLVIVSNGSVYNYNGSTLSTVTDSNINGSKAVTYINNQFVYTKDNLFIISNVGDPAAASGLNAANAESQPDNIVRAYAFQQTVYMFGESSVEPYWNTGSGNPPFERIDGQIFEVGCEALHSIAHTDNAIYWLGDDNAIYSATGGQRQRISTTAMSQEIEGLTGKSDAFAYTFTKDGLNFYVITFPAAEKTFCLNESLGDKGWFILSSGTLGKKYQGSSHVHLYNKNLIADYDNGNLYELDADTFTNNGEIIQRSRTTSSINGKILNAYGSRVQLSRIELFMEVGTGIISGQGEDPKLIWEISYDGGRSWNNEGWTKIGRMGEHTRRVELFILKSFYDAIVRISITDPVMCEIYSASIDARVTGR
jgi:hypothetical protein